MTDGIDPDTILFQESVGWDWEDRKLPRPVSTKRATPWAGVVLRGQVIELHLGPIALPGAHADKRKAFMEAARILMAGEYGSLVPRRFLRRTEIYKILDRLSRISSDEPKPEDLEFVKRISLSFHTDKPLVRAARIIHEAGEEAQRIHRAKTSTGSRPGPHEGRYLAFFVVADLSEIDPRFGSFGLEAMQALLQHWSRVARRERFTPVRVLAEVCLQTGALGLGPAGKPKELAGLLAKNLKAQGGAEFCAVRPRRGT